MKSKSNPIAAELLRIAKENGGVLQAKAVVDAARRQSSPLHSKFEWDDSLAAEQYRIEQARHLIRVTVQVISTPDGDVIDKVFVSLRADQGVEGGGYRKLSVVLTDADMRQRLLAEALADMEVFREKYSQLKELAEVFSAMKQIRNKARRKAA